VAFSMRWWVAFSMRCFPSEWVCMSEAQAATLGATDRTLITDTSYTEFLSSLRHGGASAGARVHGAGPCARRRGMARPDGAARRAARRRAPLPRGAPGGGGRGGRRKMPAFLHRCSSPRVSTNTWIWTRSNSRQNAARAWHLPSPSPSARCRWCCGVSAPITSPPNWQPPDGEARARARR
jgi:hypothetical protein